MLYLGICVFGKHIPLPFAKLQTGQVNPLLVATMPLYLNALSGDGATFKMI